MNADGLRALQAPFKARYKDDPGTAVQTMRVEGRLGVEGVTCRVETTAGPVEGGLHPSAGGDGTKACAADMLLQSLVACAGVTLGAVATALNIPIRGGTVAAEGVLDFRGTLGVSKEAPVGFKTIKVTYTLDTDADPAQVDNLLRLTERYCVVFQTLKTPPAFEVVKQLGGPGSAVGTAGRA